MGIHCRYQVALLALLFISVCSQAATRKTVNSPSAQSIISNPSAPPSFNTPYGDVAYLGQEFVDQHGVGQRFQAGNNPSSHLPAYKQQIIKLKPSVEVPATGIASKLKNALKTTPAAVAMQVATGAALAGVSWVMSDDNTKIQKKQDTVDGLPSTKSPTDHSPSLICLLQPASKTLNKITIVNHMGAQYAVGVWQGNRPADYSLFVNNCTQGQNGYVAVNGVWPQSGAKVISIGDIQSLKVDLNETDWGNLDPWLSQQSAAFLTEILKESCTASPSPGACFDSLKKNPMLSGPSSQQAQPITQTTTQTNPDGSTSTTSTTSNYSYNYTYGSNYYDYTTNVTTTTNTDGDVTTVTTNDQQPSGETPADSEDDPQDEQEQEEDYTFTDTPFSDVPSFYTQKYPDGLSGVWNDSQADFQDSEFVSFLNSFVPSFSGTCPSWSMSFGIGSMGNFGSHDFMNLCYVFDFVKAIILLGAVFLCRAIIFGG